MAERKNLYRPSNMVDCFAEILKNLPDDHAAAVARLFQSPSYAEIRKIINAANKILGHTESLSIEEARKVIRQARLLNSKLEKMRSKRGSDSKISWQY